LHEEGRSNRPDDAWYSSQYEWPTHLPPTPHLPSLLAMQPEVAPHRGSSVAPLCTSGHGPGVATAGLGVDDPPCKDPNEGDLGRSTKNEKKPAMVLV